tara:strand:+ start:284 stop:1171 length:888 start_codon:yes stop_codon:yes gene_type:complete
MSGSTENGSRREIDGKPHIFYDGYWIRYYAPPPESLSAKRDLLYSLTRRTFHHTEPGINTPGNKVEAARNAYENETDESRKRVNAAMLAGGLFNRATDLFTSIVELEGRGIHVNTDNELMRECSSCFEEALELGKQVRHSSGQEGVDELWGEPFKVFTRTIQNYYESRYVKIAQTMKSIDSIAVRMVEVLEPAPQMRGIGEQILAYAAAAREESEIMKSDPDFFYSWPKFVTLAEELKDRCAAGLPDGSGQEHIAARARQLLCDGIDLISYIAGVRVPMPKSARLYLEELGRFET